MRRRWTERLLNALVALLVPASHRDAVLGDLLEQLQGNATGGRRLARDVLDLVRNAPRWHWDQFSHAEAPESAQPAAARHRPATQGAHRTPRKEKFMYSLLIDLRYALRQLWRTPGFTVASLLVLGLGLGANVTMFSLANAILLRPPAGIESDRGFVRLLSRSEQDRNFESSLSYPDFRDLAEVLQPMATVAGYDATPFSVRISEQSERSRGAIVSGNYFQLLSILPAQGRLLTEDDDQSQANGSVAVVSHAFWRDRLGARFDVVGDVMSINGRPFEIVGVAQPGFRGLDHFDQVDVWVPMVMQPFARPGSGDLLEQRDSTWMSVVGALQSGANVADLKPALASLTRKISPNPDDTRLREFDVIAGIGPDPSDRRAATVLLGTLLTLVGLVLVIACANVANLVLARTRRRSGEIAVRRALGAGRGRLIRQLLTESLALSALAAVVGLLLALVLRGLLLQLLPDMASPSGLDLGLDRNVLLYAALLTTASGLMFGLAPLLGKAGRAALGAPLGRTASASGGRLRSALVIGQLALSVVLLMSSGLLLETMRRLQSVDPGFDSRGVATAAVDLGLQNYQVRDMASFHQSLMRTAAEHPNIDAIATATTLPLSGSSDSWGGLTIDDNEPPAGRPGWTSRVNTISPGLFDVLGIPLIRGRDFSTLDHPEAVKTVIVNAAFQRRFWPESDALGKTIRLPRGENGTPLQVVGVVGDARYGGLNRPVDPMMYVPLMQHGDARFSILAKGPDAAVASKALRATVTKLDSDLPTFAVAPLSQLEERSLWQQRMVGSLLSLFGGLALVLAAVGLYGVIACLVAERRLEIGVRLAVGANPRNVVALFLGRSVRLAAISIAFGLVGSVAAGRLLSSFLYGVSPLHPGLVAAVTAVLVIASVIAALGPASLAARLDPARVLQTES